MDVSKSSVTVQDDNSVTLCDESSRLQVQVWLNNEGWAEKVIVSALRGEVLTQRTMQIIPLTQIIRVAESVLDGEEINETFYRMLARPRSGSSWPVDHFERVYRVANWAKKIGRAGGAQAAVSEFWGVHPRTAKRWLAKVRQLQQSQPARDSSPSSTS